MKSWAKSIVYGGLLTAFIIALIWDVTYNHGSYTMRCIDYVVDLASTMARLMDQWSSRVLGSFRYQF